MIPPSENLVRESQMRERLVYIDKKIYNMIFPHSNYMAFSIEFSFSLILMASLLIFAFSISVSKR